MPPRGWGFWTEAKLDILSAYLPALATASKSVHELTYLDLFAGNASNQRRDVDRDIRGSAIRALEALPEHARIILFERDRVAVELERHLRSRFPRRQFEIVAGDCNVTLEVVLDRLRRLGVDWAPSFAFIDPYSSAALRLETIARLAEFKRRRRYKVEQWLLFYGSDIPRVLGQSQPTPSCFARPSAAICGSRRPTRGSEASCRPRRHVGTTRTCCGGVWRSRSATASRTPSRSGTRPARTSTTWCSRPTTTRATGSCARVWRRCAALRADAR